jgi:hypothetical protein
MLTRTWVNDAEAGDRAWGWGAPTLVTGTIGWSSVFPAGGAGLRSEWVDALLTFIALRQTVRRSGLRL